METEVLSKPLIANSDSHTYIIYTYSYKVNNRFYDCAENTQPSKSSSTFQPLPLLAAHRLPGPSSLSTSSLLVQLGNTCDLRGWGNFHLPETQTCTYFFVLDGCWDDCIPTDLIIKGESHSESER